MGCGCNKSKVSKSQQAPAKKDIPVKKMPLVRPVAPPAVTTTKKKK